jgi:hypothetical protein
MKILLENFRKFLTEEAESNQQKIYRLITNDDPAYILQGMELAPIGAPTEYAQAIEKAIKYVADQFDILSNSEGIQNGYDPEDRELIGDLYKKSFNIKSVEQLESFLNQYLKIAKYIDDEYGPWDRWGSPFPDNFMGHGPEDVEYGGYPDTIKLEDFFNKENKFMSYYVRHELENILKDTIPKEETDEEDYGF